MVSWLRKFLQPKREPDFLIGPSKEDPYLRRWWLIPRNKFFNIYLHHMIHDDEDRAPHDHPWASLSLCLEGYIEEHQLVDVKQNLWTINGIFAGDWKWRGTTYLHKLKLPRGDAWTLFFTGPVVRVWGFQCPQGWREWKKFVNPRNKGEPGLGCGEE